MTVTQTLPIITGISQVLDRYDGFILDLWGVIHDGQTPYPGAHDTLKRLKAAGKRTILLSNAPRRGFVLTEMMEKMGIERGCYDEVMSSGEAVHQELATRRDPWFAKLGPKFFHIGALRDFSVFEGLSDYRKVEDPAEADWVLNTGTEGFEEEITRPYREALDACLAAGPLPMVCANPDIIIVRDGKRIICAGVLAEDYASKGGAVVYRGKPDPAIYDVCLEKLGLPRDRVAGVGDAFHTDVAGALGAGIASLWVMGGIHRSELGTAWGQVPNAEAVERVIAHHGGQRPTAAIPAFLW